MKNLGSICNMTPKKLWKGTTFVILKHPTFTCMISLSLLEFLTNNFYKGTCVVHTCKKRNRQVCSFDFFERGICSFDLLTKKFLKFRLAKIDKIKKKNFFRKNVFFHYFTSTYVDFSPNLQENMQYVVLTSSKRYMYM